MGDINHGALLLGSAYSYIYIYTQDTAANNQLANNQLYKDRKMPLWDPDHAAPVFVFQEMRFTVVLPRSYVRHEIDVSLVKFLLYPLQGIFN